METSTVFQPAPSTTLFWEHPDMATAESSSSSSAASSSAEDSDEFTEDDAFDAVDSGVNDEYYRRDVGQLFKILRAQATSNAEYFKGATGVANQRFYATFVQLWEHLDRGVESGVDCLLRAAPVFDYSPLQPGNGFRSMVTVVHRCCLRIVTLARYVAVNRESYLFRADHYSRELEAYVNVLGQLRACLYYLQKLLPYCADGNLFSDEESLPTAEYQTAERLMKDVESLSQEAFYGRCLGFQFCPTMVRPLTTVNLVMASYGDVFVRSSRIMKVAASVLSSQKYFRNPELRAQQVVNVTRNNDIQFCKGFWALAESTFMHKMPLYMCPAVAVDKVIVIGPESFSMPLVNHSGYVQILPPSAHTGIAPVNTRLISAQYRHGQEVWQKSGSKAPHGPSPNLIIHCHGGGFVAQSSASHQVYLRHWANDLEAPIFCIDYSLAPENRFPRQFEEVFYAYCWAIQNCHLLGSTAQRVCIVGDSAGANLAVSVAMKVAEVGLRKPDGILSVYGCQLVKYVPSPSRILSLMDPLLPLGVLSLCLQAYTGDSESSDNVGNSLHVINQLPAADDDSQNSTTCYPPSTNHPPLAPVHQLTRNCNDNRNCVSQSKPNGSSSRTDTGVDDRTQRTVVNSELDGDQLTVTVCPSGKAVNSRVPKPAPLSSSHELHSHPMMKSCSVPSFRALPFVRSLKITDGVVLDNELFHLSTYADIKHFTASPIDIFKTGHISRSPYLSPLLASDKLLRGLGPVHLMACHLDPMLDDSVMFGRRLRDIGNQVQIDFISDLPHGFLNFVLVSHEAKSASDRCVQALRKMLVY